MLTEISIAVLHLPHSPSPQRADQALRGEFLLSKFRPPRIRPHIGQSRCKDLSHMTEDPGHPHMGPQSTQC